MTRTFYLHGFGSGVGSVKAKWCVDWFTQRGEPLDCLDLNWPSFTEQTTTGLIHRITQLDEARGDHAPPLTMIGSSFGAYLSCRYAELFPSKVKQLILMCPAFDIDARWPLIFEDKVFKAWEREGFTTIPDGTGTLHDMPWGFVIDARKHPAYPKVSCPVVILQGLQDPIVPPEYPRRYLEFVPHAKLIEVEDDHNLRHSKDTLYRILEEHLTF